MWAIVQLTPYTITGQAPKRLNCLTYNVNDGLLQSQVSDLTQDGNGFTWISFGNGIQRFDGRNFYGPPNAENGEGGSRDKNAKFFPLKNGNLWLVHEKGLSEYNRHTNRITELFSAQKIPGFLYPVMETEDDRSIWCWYDSKGYFKLDKQKGQFVDSVLAKGIRLPVSNGNLFPLGIKYFNDQFLLLAPDFLLVINKKTKETKVYHPNASQQKFFAMDLTGTDSILVATKIGVEWMNYQNGSSRVLRNYKTQPLTLNPLHPVQLKIIDPFTCIVSEGNRLFEMDLSSGLYRSELLNQQNKPLVEIGYITGLIKDHYENLWVITENDGIRKINYRYAGFRYFGSTDRQNNFVKSIYADKRDNRVLLGSFGNGLTIYDTSGYLLRNIKSIPGLDPPYTICGFIRTEAHRYLMFIMGTWSVYLLNTQDYSVVPVNVNVNDVDKDVIRTQRPDYHLTVHTVSPTLSIIQSGYSILKLEWIPPRTVRYQLMDSLEYATLSSFYDVDNNKLWVGSYGKYVYTDINSGSSRSFELPGNKRVRCFAADKKGNIWTGGEKGLFQLNTKGEIIKSWNKLNGLVDESIYAIRHDKFDNTWFSHNKGISCLKADGSFLHFNKNDGLQENEFNTNTSFETDDGELFFGGVNGVSSFYPNAVTSVAEKPEILLTTVAVRDQSLQLDTASWSIQQIKLPYSDNIMSFTFTAIGNRSADQYNYQYQLAGQDVQWIDGSNNPQVRYVLQPGDYTLRYYAGNSFEKNPVNVKHLHIIIEPPFWRTTWFIAIALIAVILAIVLLTRSITRRKLKKQIAELERNKALNEERLRISREMHDDIGAGLTQITLMSEAAKNPDKGKETLDEIAGTSRKLVGSINEIIWSLNPQNQSLEQLLAYLREQLHHLLEYSGIQYTIDFPENGKDTVLSNAQRRNILLVTKEIVHNAVKHSHAKNIHINCLRNTTELVFDITDDGQGFDTSKNGTGNGLRNIRRRVEELGGDLDISSITAAGSRFHYHFPLQ